VQHLPRIFSSVKFAERKSLYIKILHHLCEHKNVVQNSAPSQLGATPLYLRDIKPEHRPDVQRESEYKSAVKTAKGLKQREKFLYVSRRPMNFDLAVRLLIRIVFFLWRTWTPSSLLRGEVLSKNDRSFYCSARAALCHSSISNLT
jgi:hypothetical protein